MTTAKVFSKLARLLGGDSAPKATNGRVPVWVTRLQRDDNPWLKAERLEQQGQLADARRLYQQDIDQQNGRGHHGRVAVARAASAEITARLGDHALALSERQRAAELFRRHAEEAMAWSIREAAWSYERAAAQYARAAGLLTEAEEMRRCATDLKVHQGGYQKIPVRQSDAVLHALATWRSRGLTVFTLDYANSKELAQYAVARARAYGLIPYVGQRELNRVSSW